MPKQVHDVAKHLQSKGMGESKSWRIAYGMRKKGTLKKAARTIARRTKRKS